MIAIKLSGRKELLRWHCGQKNPLSDLMADPEYVQAVQVSSGELEWVRWHLGLAKDVRSGVVRFYGDQAKFIVGNLHP